MALKRGTPPGYKEARANAQKAFLEAFEAVGDVEVAARKAGISTMTPYDWEASDPSFLESFTRARTKAAHLLALEANHIIEKTIQELRDPEMLHIHSAVGNPIARLRMLHSENKKWQASKWNREVYGDKQDVSLSGTVALPAPTLNVHDAPKTETPT